MIMWITCGVQFKSNFWFSSICVFHFQFERWKKFVDCARIIFRIHSILILNVVNWHQKFLFLVFFCLPPQCSLNRCSIHDCFSHHGIYEENSVLVRRGYCPTVKRVWTFHCCCPHRSHQVDSHADWTSSTRAIRSNGFCCSPPTRPGHDRKLSQKCLQHSDAFVNLPCRRCDVCNLPQPHRMRMVWFWPD